MVYTIRIKICLIFVYHERKIIHNVLLIATNSIWAIKYISLSSVFPSSSSPFFHVLYGFSFVSEQNQKRKHSTSIIFHNSKTMKAKLRQREREHVVQTNMHKYEGMHWVELIWTCGRFHNSVHPQKQQFFSKFDWLWIFICVFRCSILRIFKIFYIEHLHISSRYIYSLAPTTVRKAHDSRLPHIDDASNKFIQIQ